MIIYLSASSHNYTVRPLLSIDRQSLIHSWSYHKLLNCRRLPLATYVFTDFDRLNFWELEQAADAYRQLKAAGATVLNDPARVCQRLALLKRLYTAGINSFRAWGLDETIELGDRPVFIRTQSAHRGVLSELIHDTATLESEIERFVCLGYPGKDLMVVEYAAEENEAGIFRKLNSLRIGNRFINLPSVNQREWVAKYGEKGLGSERINAEDLDNLRTERYSDEMRKAFQLAGIEHGRADYSQVNGRLEIYEINTNPQYYSTIDHPSPIRVQALELCRDEILQAFAAINTPISGKLKLQGRARKYRMHGRWRLTKDSMP